MSQGDALYQSYNNYLVVAWSDCQEVWKARTPLSLHWKQRILVKYHFYMCLEYNLHSHVKIALQSLHGHILMSI